jgi:hypothetical protein
MITYRQNVIAPTALDEENILDKWKCLKWRLTTYRQHMLQDHNLTLQELKKINIIMKAN